MSSRYVVVLIQNPKNSQEYLLGRRLDNGKINFPAGGVNDGEEPIQGASREVKEETGFDAKNLKMLGVYSKKDKQGKPIMVYTYSADVDGSPNLENDPDREFQSIFWQNPLTVPSNELHVPPNENSGLKALVEQVRRKV